MTEAVLAGLIKQILTALHFLHSYNLVHGDIKLANVAVSETTHASETMPVVKLRELGVSELLRGIDDRNKKLTGSPMYMAPELCSEKAYDAKCDIWSCGILAFQLFSKQAPYDTRKMDLEGLKNLIKDSPFPGRVDDKRYILDISEQAKQFLKKILTVDPTTRPTAEQLLREDWLSTQENTIMKNHYTALDGAVKSEVRSLSIHRA